MNLSTLGAAHGAAAVAALVFGFVVLADRKGTSTHRALGAAYVAAMIATNLTALGVYRLTGQCGPFHVLALISLVPLSQKVALDQFENRDIGEIHRPTDEVRDGSPQIRRQ